MREVRSLTIRAISIFLKTPTLKLLMGAFIFSAAAELRAQTTPLNKSLAPQDDSEISHLFKDMGVVQRKAMKKAGRFVLSNYGALDFSDGPYSMYAFNVNPGFALSDFWEIYINAVPFFISQARGIVKDIESLVLDSDAYPGSCTGATVCRASVSFIKPKYQLGGELLWAPAYGKDSVGATRVIRSDTFFKFGVMNVFYEGGESGLKFHTAVGKTYFLGDSMGFRVSASANYMQTLRSVGVGLAPQKGFKFFAIVEAGLAFYL